MPHYYHFAADMPRQSNCIDCGVYTICFLRWFCGYGSAFGCESVEREMRFQICDEVVLGQIYEGLMDWRK